MLIGTRMRATMVELPGSGAKSSHCKPDILLVVGAGRATVPASRAPGAGSAVCTAESWWFWSGARRRPAGLLVQTETMADFGGAFWQGVVESADGHSQFPADCLPGSASQLSTPGAGPAGRRAGTAAMLAGCLRLLHTRHHPFHDHFPFKLTEGRPDRNHEPAHQ